MPTPRKTPQDHNRPGDNDMFLYTVASGDVIRLPKMEHIGSGLVRKFRHLTDADFMYSVLEKVLTDAELETLDRVPLGEINKLFRAWQEEAGATFPQS